jgi:hypothetical protein
MSKTELHEYMCAPQKYKHQQINCFQSSCPTGKKDDFKCLIALLF